MADNYDQYSREELLRLLRERDRKPKFGLVWERDEIEHDQSLNSDFVALDLDPALSCGDAPFENLIIEGDNFDALRYLRMTHAGRVKCIYIDPPYNTGNRDFIYNDRFVDKEDAYRHSKWLEFMYRRMVLAKELLADDGVIFVSIDDNEMLHLGMLMDQVFGEANRIATCIWQKVFSPKNTAMHFSDDHEYVLVYANKRDAWRPNAIPRTDAQDSAYKNPDNDPRGVWTSSDLSARNYYGAGTYPVTNPVGRIIPGPPEGRYWTVAEEKFKELDADNRIWWGKTGNNTPRLKRFLSDVKQGVVPQTLWSYEEVGHTQEAKKELLDVLEFSSSSDVFSTPKPTRLIERILRIATKADDLVLDFFAGSGTTAHAVMKLNAEDSGRRRFILVSSTEATNEEPGKNLCRDVCAERVRRVAQGYANKKGEAVAGLGGGFAYLRTKRIPLSRVFNGIQHEQVWRALQLMRGEGLAKFDRKAAVHVSAHARGTPLGAPPLRGGPSAGSDDGKLVYVPKLTDAAVAEVARLAASGGRLVVYSWQPGLLQQRIGAENVTLEKIPEYLVKRFGGNKK